MRALILSFSVVKVVIIEEKSASSKEKVVEFGIISYFYGNKMKPCIYGILY